MKRFSIVLKEDKPCQGERMSKDVFSFWGSYWLYQDQIGWSRIQTLVAVKAAIFATVFIDKIPQYISIILHIFGVFSVWWIYSLMVRDWQIRDYISSILDRNLCGDRLIPERKAGILRGKTLLQVVVLLLLLANLITSFVKFMNWRGKFVFSEPVYAHWLSLVLMFSD